MSNGMWQYAPRPRSWYLRAIDAARDIPYLWTDRVSSDGGWRMRAFGALLFAGFLVALTAWLVGWALRGWHVA